MQYTVRDGKYILFNESHENIGPLSEFQSAAETESGAFFFH